MRLQAVVTKVNAKHIKVFDFVIAHDRNEKRDVKQKTENTMTARNQTLRFKLHITVCIKKAYLVRVWELNRHNLITKRTFLFTFVYISVSVYSLKGL